MNPESVTCPMQLWALYPELVVAGSALCLVAVAGWVRGWARYLPVWTALASVAAAIVLSARMLPWEPMTIFCGTYAVDGFGNGFKLVVLSGAFITLLLLPAYFRNHTQTVHAPAAVLLATLGCMGLTSSLDLGLIVLFLQMLSLATYLLVCLRREDPMGNEATLKYFIYAAAALAIMAYGLTFLYGLTGSLNLIRIGAALRAGADVMWPALALGLILVGYGFEMTIAPFQFWAPDVFQGATAPVSGFISVVPKAAAFAGLLRLLLGVFPDVPLDWPLMLAWLAAATMTVGNLAALRQTRLKRLLAYSSIAQAGYVLMAVAVSLQAPKAISATGFYLAAYLFMNLGAFAVAAQMERTLGSDSLAAFAGLGRTSPGPAAVMTLSLLSLAGIPPLAGFAGKVLLLEAVLAGGMVWLAVFAVVNMTVALWYYVAVAAQMYMRPPHPGTVRPTTDLLMGITLTLCLAGTLLFGIYPGLLLGITDMFQRMIGAPPIG